MQDILWVMHEHLFRASIPLTTFDVQESAGSVGHRIHCMKCKAS